MGPGRRVAAAIALSATLLGAPAFAAPRDTTERTIQDHDGDNLLEYARGETHTVIGAPPGYRPSRRGSLLNFLQLSDFQMVDEESPGRVEPVDTTQRSPGSPFSAAYRPMESLTTQVTEAMVRNVRDARSPITGEPAELTVLTGDNADSQQYNETRWFIDILDGERKIDPDSGVKFTCDGQPVPDNGSPYDGVRAGGHPGTDSGYYEPDRSSGPDEDGDGYSPDRGRNQAEVPGPHADVTVRDFPGLLEAAQRKFESKGLDMPWYTAFGNHDALVQGNSPDAYFGPTGPSGESVNPVYDGLARGCLKPTKVPTGVDPAAFAADPADYLSGSAPAVVPADDRRCYLAKDTPTGAFSPCVKGFIREHSNTRGEPRGHGFEPFSVDGQRGDGRPGTARVNHDGYYSFKPRKGLRFIVFDSVTDECDAPVCSEGSVDDQQYHWIASEIARAAAAREYVLLFSHHTLRTTRMPGDGSENPIHYGERWDQRDRKPVRPDGVKTLKDLFCASPNVLAHVNGHEHANVVIGQRCPDAVPADPEVPAAGPVAFYEVSSAAHIDWPQQSREVELLENEDDTISLVLTMIDHDGPPNPDGGGGDGDGGDGDGFSAFSVERLASIARELAYNDYQGSRGARGEPEDRNVIIKTSKRWPADRD